MAGSGESSWEPSEQFYTHALTPANLGTLPPPAVQGKAVGSCGDRMELYLELDEAGRIKAARFMPEGCLHTVACGSAVTTLIEGKALEEAATITPEDVEQALGGLPRDHRHCAVLAVTALRSALRRRAEDARQPWKALYRRR